MGNGGQQDNPWGGGMGGGGQGGGRDLWNAMNPNYQPQGTLPSIGAHPHGGIGSGIYGSGFGQPAGGGKAPLGGSVGGPGQTPEGQIGGGINPGLVADPRLSDINNPKPMPGGAPPPVIDTWGDLGGSVGGPGGQGHDIPLVDNPPPPPAAVPAPSYTAKCCGCLGQAKHTTGGHSGKRIRGGGKVVSHSSTIPICQPRIG